VKRIRPYIVTVGVIALIAGLLVLQFFQTIHDPKHSMGFGPGWSCTTYGKASATVCERDAASVAK
jgi:hypothetical protein